MGVGKFLLGNCSPDSTYCPTNVKFEEQLEVFQGREGVLWNQHTLTNFSSKRPRRAKFWRFFFWILLKLHFEWKIQPKDGHNYRLFSQNQGTFFDFQKGQGLSPSPPSFPDKFSFLSHDLPRILLSFSYIFLKISE